MKVTLVAEQTGYHNAKDHRIAYTRGRGQGRTITTRPLPMKYVAFLQYPDTGRWLRLTLIIGVFGSEATGDYRAGVRSSTLEAFTAEGNDDPSPVSREDLQAIALETMASRALAAWATADDRKPVTPGEARQLLRSGSVPEEVEDRWRRVSRRYLEAKAAHQPTTEAVIDELNLLPNQDSAARQAVSRAGRSGVLAEVAEEMGLTHLLTPKQRPGRSEAER